MSHNHSEETHRNLVARIPAATGRQLSEWFHMVEDGPSFSRFDEHVNWLGRAQPPARIRHGDRARAPHGAGSTQLRLKWIE